MRNAASSSKKCNRYTRSTVQPKQESKEYSCAKQNADAILKREQEEARQEKQKEK